MLTNLLIYGASFPKTQDFVIPEEKNYSDMYNLMVKLIIVCVFLSVCVCIWNTVSNALNKKINILNCVFDMLIYVLVGSIGGIIINNYVSSDEEKAQNDDLLKEDDASTSMMETILMVLISLIALLYMLYVILLLSTNIFNPPIMH